MANQKSISFALLFLLLRSPFMSNNKQSFDYIFQFGDSINDTGNFLWDGNNVTCNLYPYGISLSEPSTRCSNGLLMIDYFAKFFNLTINPYLDKKADLSQGVNFAVAGATALGDLILREKQIVSPHINNSLSFQLKWFKSHLSSFCNGALDCREKLKKALIFMGEIGGNDYNFALKMGQSMEELYQLVPDVILTIKDATKELIMLGAKTMVIPGNFPIGCVPSMLANFQSDDFTKYDDLNCLIDLNDFCIFHNNLLQVAIKELQQEFPHVTIVYADYFSALRWVINKARSLGYDKDDIQKACCGKGANKYNFDNNKFCGDQGVSACVHPNKRISWDGIHFTQHAYQHMAYWLLQRLIPNIMINNNEQVGSM